MKKFFIKILSAILVLILIVFIIYKIDTINRTKDKIIDRTKMLMEAISSEEYDEIRKHIRNIDGTELTDKQISNFLLNTELYRATLKEENSIFTYSANVNFFHTRKGSIVFTFNALDGKLITNEIGYVHDGINEYLTTDKIQDTNKEKERYPIAVDLANGKSIEYKKSEDDDDIEKIRILSYVQDENGKIFVEIIKEAKEDIRQSLLNSIYEQRASLKNIDENYNIEWDDEFKEFSIYYDESVEKKVIANEMKLTILSCSSSMQVLGGNEDWHLTINYYDYNTKELLKTEKIR